VKQKARIIRIDDVSDIDTTKVSIYDLNNRYVDKKGNLFGLKYNRLTKKVDIIKLMRTHYEDAPVIQQKVIQKKISESRKPLDEISESSLNDFGTDLMEQDEQYYDPEVFIDDTLSLMHTHGERLKGIIKNLVNSNVFPKENKADSIELDDIFRSIEIDGIQKFDKIDTYKKELTSYPRSTTHYQSKMDKRGREIIDKLSDKTEKAMKFIYLYEMNQSIREVYAALNIFIDNLIKFMSTKDLESMKHLTSLERQAFNDAEISIQTTKDDIRKILEEIPLVEEYITNIENLK
jgi:hypothetical protein